MNALLALFVPLVIAYLPALRWCVDRWNAPTQYFAHGWLVPFVAAAVVWSRRAVWRTAPVVPDRRGLWLLGAGLLLHVCGLVLMVDSWSAASLCLTVPGALWFAFGRARLRGLWPVIGLVLFFVPLPIFVEGRLAFTLKEFAVNGGAALANVLGADVVRSGSMLRPNGMTGGLWVADACSGLRSLLAMAMLTWCLAFFTGPAVVWRRVVLLLAAAPIAIVANVVRIATICLFARWFGLSFAENLGHTLANVAEWIADLAALLALDAVLRRGAARTGAPTPIVAVPDPRPRPAFRGVAVAAWVLAGPLLWLGVHRPIADGHDRADTLPPIVGTWTLVPRAPAEEQKFQKNLPRFRELLGTDDFTWRTYRDGEGHALHLVGLFHDTNWKSVHPPRICIEGSDMDVEVDELVAAPWLGNDVQVSRIVAKRRADGRRFVTLSVFGTASWLSGSYGAFFLHHAPRALLRQSESGFLLRVEAATTLGNATADARCADFLRALVPEAQRLLR